MSIYVRPVGGLGNQLFIYATGRAIAHATGQDLVIRTDWYQRHQDRRYELNSFAYQGNEIASTSHLDVPFFGNSIITKLLSVAPNWTGQRVYREKSFRHDCDVFERVPVTGEFRGYFQSWKYFEEIADTIRSEVRQIINATSWFNDTLDHIQSFGAFAAIHLRLTDYLKPELRWLHGWTGQDYYQRAIRLLHSIKGELPLFVFTDDLDSAKKIIPTWFPSAQLISPPLDSRPIESLVLMSQATALIASNSTYSWWAGWLEHNEERPVIVPRPWMTVQEMPDWDLLLPDWLSIGRTYDQQS